MPMTWEEQAAALTPVECRDGRWFKRDDLLTPLGPGCPDGAKMRNLIHMLGPYAARGGEGVITGGSVLSPAIGRVAVAARHYGLRCCVVLGGTKPETMTRHPNVAICILAGAELKLTRVAYNPAIQAALRDLAAERPTWLRMGYGITIPDDAPDEEVERFYAVGAAQVANLPGEIETLIVPAGSCNTAAAVLYGIAQHQPERLCHVDLVGLGPRRTEWMDRRLEAVERVSGLTIRAQFGDDRRYSLLFHDLHGDKFATYADRRPYRLSGIDLHPTYEGKAMTYMDQHRDRFASWWAADSTALFWIVGGESSLPAVERAMCAA